MLDSSVGVINLQNSHEKDMQFEFDDELADILDDDLLPINVDDIPLNIDALEDVLDNGESIGFDARDSGLGSISPAPLQNKNLTMKTPLQLLPKNEAKPAVRNVK